MTQPWYGPAKLCHGTTKLCRGTAKLRRDLGQSPQNSHKFGILKNMKKPVRAKKPTCFPVFPQWLTGSSPLAPNQQNTNTGDQWPFFTPVTRVTSSGVFFKYIFCWKGVAKFCLWTPGVYIYIYYIIMYTINTNVCIFALNWILNIIYIYIILYNHSCYVYLCAPLVFYRFFGGWSWNGNTSLFC